MVTLTDEEFTRIANYIKQQYGIDLTKKRFLIESKLTVELLKLKLDSYAQYKKYLEQDLTGRAKAQFLDIMTTNYTYFYREEAHYNYLETILKEMPRQPAVFRVWSAGCSSGQEAYTTAMKLEELRSQGWLKGDYKIIGTDISVSAVEAAKQGKYSVADYVRLPETWQKHYCYNDHSTVAIKQAIKQHVLFMNRNLLEPWPPSEKFNLIFCRNVMIYFDTTAREKLLHNLYAALAPGGYLFIGHSEIITPVPGLQYLRPAVYKKAGVAIGS